MKKFLTNLCTLVLAILLALSSNIIASEKNTALRGFAYNHNFEMIGELSKIRVVHSGNDLELSFWISEEKYSFFVVKLM